MGKSRFKSPPKGPSRKRHWSLCYLLAWDRFGVHVTVMVSSCLDVGQSATFHSDRGQESKINFGLLGLQRLGRHPVLEPAPMLMWDAALDSRVIRHCGFIQYSSKSGGSTNTPRFHGHVGGDNLKPSQISHPSSDMVCRLHVASETSSWRRLVSADSTSSTTSSFTPQLELRPYLECFSSSMCTWEE